MNKRVLGSIVFLLVIASIFIPIIGTVEESNINDQLLNERSFSSPILATLEIAIDTYRSNEVYLDNDIYEIFEGKYLKIDVIAYWYPINMSKQICLWADNTTMPNGASLTPICNCDDGIVSSIFDWTPGIGQAGTYMIRFYVGKSCYSPIGSFTITIIVNPSGSDNPPVVIINSPEDKITVNNPDITVVGYAEDDNELFSFGRRHEWTDNQQESSSTFPIPRPTFHSFEERFTLYEGWNQITIYVSDSEGQNGQDQIILYYEEPVNQPPNKPIRPSGSMNGTTGTNYQYESYFSDPNGDILEIKFDWGDGTDTGWIGPIVSGSSVGRSHTYTTDGTYPVKTKARDIPFNEESEWSESLIVSMPKSKTIDFLWFEIVFHRLIQIFPWFELFLQ